MKHNLGIADMIGHGPVTLIISGYGFYNNSWLGILAVIPMAMSILRFNRIYTIFGIFIIEAKIMATNPEKSNFVAIKINSYAHFNKTSFGGK